MIEIHTRNFDLHMIVPSPNLASLCRNLDYKPYSINFVNLNGAGAKVVPVFQSYGNHSQITEALAPVLPCFYIHCILTLHVLQSMSFYAIKAMSMILINVVFLLQRKSKRKLSDKAQHSQHRYVSTGSSPDSSETQHCKNK